MMQKGNLISLPLTNVSAFSREKALWDVRTHQHEGAVITIDVQIAGSAPVGVWKMKILSYVTGNLSADPEVYEIPQNVYILFNPWSKGGWFLYFPFNETLSKLTGDRAMGQHCLPSLYSDLRNVCYKTCYVKGGCLDFLIGNFGWVSTV